VARSDFQATWVPRIGAEATAELRRFRKVGGFTIVTPVFAGAAGLLFGGGTLNDLLAVVCSAIAISFLVAFINGQKRLADAVSYWFGVRIQAGQLPPMSPGRFDTWREKRGLHPSDELADGHVDREPLESMTLMSWSLPAPDLWADEQMLWSRIGYISRPKGWLEGTFCVTSERVMFVPSRIGGISIAPPKVRQFPLPDFVSIELEDHSSTHDSDRMRQCLKFTFRGGRSLLVAVDETADALAELRALLSVSQDV
jgi:hypothetical protein